MAGFLWCFQSKHQKHQAFEAELHANADRIRGVIDMGNSLIDRGACAGSEDAVKVRRPPAPLLLAREEEGAGCDFQRYCQLDDDSRMQS